MTLLMPCDDLSQTFADHRLRLRFRTAASKFAAQFQMALFGGPKPKRDSVIGNMETQINSVWDVSPKLLFFSDMGWSKLNST